MVLALSSDYIYVRAMLKTTPLVVTVGLSLTIPLAIAGDFFLKKPVPGQVVLGAVIVLLSFIAIGAEDAGRSTTPDEGSTSSAEVEDYVVYEELAS